MQCFLYLSEFVDRRLTMPPLVPWGHRHLTAFNIITLTIRIHLRQHLRYAHTLYIGYTAIGYGAKSVEGWVLGCPDLPTVNLIGYNAKNRL